MKILIVEDDALLLQGLVLALVGAGYVCDGVSTVRSAEAHLASGLYSLVVLDIGLPTKTACIYCNACVVKSRCSPF